jgi:sporulation protein YlmC with PRC-barrel domain
VEEERERSKKMEVKNVDIPLNVEVFCMDGHIGRSTNVVLNPITEVITHLVVRLDEWPHTEYLVSTRLVGETTPASVNLHCTSQQLQAEPPFEETEFVRVEIPHFSGVFGWPVAVPETRQVVNHHHHIPLNEIAVRRGAHVRASDGNVGQIDEFLANPDGHITHLLLRKGHFWGHNDIAIPVSAVKHFGQQLVDLKLNKQQIEALPSIAIRR